MLLRSDWMMVSQCTENSKVPPHEISRCARVQLSVCQREGGGGEVLLGTNVQSCVANAHFLELIKAHIKTHRSGGRPTAFWGRRGFSRGRSRNAGRVERRCPAGVREGSEFNAGPAKGHV